MSISSPVFTTLLSTISVSLSLTKTFSTSSEASWQMIEMLFSVKFSQTSTVSFLMSISLSGTFSTLSKVRFLRSEVMLTCWSLQLIILVSGPSPGVDTSDRSASSLVLTASPSSVTISWAAAALSILQSSSASFVNSVFFTSLSSSLTVSEVSWADCAEVAELVLSDPSLIFSTAPSHSSPSPSLIKMQFVPTFSWSRSASSLFFATRLQRSSGVLTNKVLLIHLK